MDYVHHGRPHKEQQTDTRPFEERLQTAIDLIKSTYLPKGCDYCLSFYAAPPNGFQVVSSAILEATDDGAVGFGLHLPFDDDEKMMERSLAEKTGTNITCTSGMEFPPINGTWE
jgi:hypothetical protein